MLKEECSSKKGILRVLGIIARILLGIGVNNFKKTEENKVICPLKNDTSLKRYDKITTRVDLDRLSKMLRSVDGEIVKIEGNAIFVKGLKSAELAGYVVSDNKSKLNLESLGYCSEDTSEKGIIKIAPICA